MAPVGPRLRTSGRYADTSGVEPELKGPPADSETGSPFSVSGPPGAGSGPSAGAVDLDAAAVSRQFWLSHMRIGFAVFLAEGLAVVGYLWMTPSGPHRPLLWTTTGLWIAFGAANLSGTGWVADKAWRSTFSLGWTVLSVLAVGGVVALDGGLGSPLVYLLFLPISYAAWAFSPVGSALCGGTTVATAGVLGLADRNPGVHPGQAFMLFAVLAGTAALATSAARNRARREARGAAGRPDHLARIDRHPHRLRRPPGVPRAPRGRSGRVRPASSPPQPVDDRRRPVQDRERHLWAPGR